ncbi:uncharacterized protein METZ01_LOCUS398801, partial [marine metagenome]
MLQKYVKQLNPRDETYVPHVDKIQVIKESYKKAALDMEEVIVYAAGGPPFVSDLIPNSEEVGKK